MAVNQIRVSSTKTSGLLAWMPLLVLPAAVVAVTTAAWPRWLRMWLIAFAVFTGCKSLTWQKRRPSAASVWRHLVYLFAWPGMDADAFLSGAARRPKFAEWLFATCKTIFGALLLFGLARPLHTLSPLATGWAGMIGIVFILHFGSFHLLSCLWRSVGVDAKPLMIWPILSVSVAEFWGRRWNTAFRDLTHRHMFRPLSTWLGASWALFIVFVFSGLVHELVITVPAGYGYGGPTVFFLMQGLAIFAERSRFGKSIGLGNGWRGRLFTFTFLVPPAPLLFSSGFVRVIVLPFMEFLQAT